MGMTIDEVEQWAKQNKFTIVADEWWDAAQDIINKYQNIEQILKKRHGELVYKILDEIIRVVEEGNDDR